MVMGNLGCTTHGATMVIPAPGIRPGVDARGDREGEMHGRLRRPDDVHRDARPPRLPKRDLSSLRTGIMAGSVCPVEVMKRCVNEMNMASGRTYTTTPGGALFFPQLAVPTGTLTLPTPGHQTPTGTWPCPPENAPEPKTAPTAWNGNAASTAPATPLTHHPSKARRSASRRSRTGRDGRARRARTGPNPRPSCRHRHGRPRGRHGR